MEDVCMKDSTREGIGMEEESHRSATTNHGDDESREAFQNN